MNAVLFGTGWRAAFFLRIASALPDVLSVSAVYSRSPERAEELRREGLHAVASREEALAQPHDAVIVASGREGYMETLRYLHARGEKILSETTLLSLPDEELEEASLFEGMVLEQYAYTPLFASALSVLSEAGEVDQLYLSGLHNHHAAAIARRVLAAGNDGPEEVLASNFPSTVIKTGSRNGLERCAGMEEYTRRVRIIRFGSSLFINDFSSNQYHCYLYGKRFEIRGTRGVITEKGLSTVDPSGYPVFIPFVFHRDTVTGNGSLALSHVTLGDKTVFENPYYPKMLNDDEIAIARMLELWGKGEDIYPFREGVADARLGRLL